MSSSFVHLRLHTEFSLVDSVVRIPQLAKSVVSEGMPAVAMTDQCNLFAMVKFYNQMSRVGVKPIFGADLWIRNDDAQKTPHNLLLLCQNKAGFRNLTELVSKAYLEGSRLNGTPMVEFDWLQAHHEGIIALSGGRTGQIGKAILSGEEAVASSLVDHYQAIYPNRFYLELQRTGREGDELCIQKTVELAAAKKIPVVATNDVRFIDADDFAAHEVRVCIHDGRVLDDPRRPKLYTQEQHLKSPEQMQALFEDIPSAITNSVEIAKRCNVAHAFEGYYLPEFPVPEGETTDSYFRRVSKEGLQERLDTLQANGTWDEDILKEYWERLDIEINVILDMGFPGYFLIVADFIQWAKNNDVPVGPGRGSGAGSIVAYALKITDLDPIEYDLLFERFLNPERISMPDFDVDFCMDGRDRVIDYVAQTYGRDQVSQIITYGTLGAKAVVRDVGRVMGHGYGFVDSIAKMIPFEVGMTLTKALEESPDLKERYEQDEEVQNLIEMALKLEGLARNAGKHAGGVVIAPEKLTNFTPLYCEEGGGSLVTQFDKDDVEAIGLVKFDFLGLRNLTIIDNAVKDINRQRATKNEVPLDIIELPLDDAPTFDLLKAQNTTAIFQLESSGMKNLIKKLQPDCFEDIIALVALFRPGPLDSGMVDDFIDRKHNRAPVSYPHPDYEYAGLEPVLKPTYGIILYQEQVMQIAQVMGGYSLGGADMLRRAMGKKKPEEMEKQKSIFLEGCEKNDIDRKLAENIFDLVEKFAGYGFNKSHSAAYALVSYQTAWLKTHYPAEFMAAVLSADMDNTDKVVTLIEDSRANGLIIQVPSINESSYKFTVQDSKTIRYGLGAIKGVGQAIVEDIKAEREQNGQYNDLHDLCRRVSDKKLNRRVLEALILAGAMDEIAHNRASIMAAIDDALQMAAQHQKNAMTGQVDIFGTADLNNDYAPVEIKALDPWNKEYLLQQEKSVLGLYLTGHPFDNYRTEMIQITKKRLLEHAESLSSKPQRRFGQQEKRVTVAGWVIALRYQFTKSGKKIALITLDDRSARLTVKMMGDELLQYEHLINKDTVMIAEGGLGIDPFNEEPQVSAKQLYNLDQARSHFAKQVDIRLVAEPSELIDATSSISLNDSSLSPQWSEQLSTALRPYQGEQCPVVVHFSNRSAKARLVLGAEWNVIPKESLINDLRALFGENRVKVRY